MIDFFDLLLSKFVQAEKLKEVVHKLLSADGDPAYMLSDHPLYLLIAKTILLNCRTELTDSQVNLFYYKFD